MTVEGIDVSSYQRIEDARKVAAAGKAFVIVKASEGLARCATFAEQWAAFRGVMLRAAYHFVRAGVDATEQTKGFLDILNGDPGELAPWGDFEVLDGQSPSGVLDAIEAWIEIVTAYCGRPVVYTGPAFWSGIRAADSARTDAVAARADLAVAAYGPAAAPRLGTWTPRFWQYSGSGTCDGVAGKVDLDRWLGTLEELRAYATGWRRTDAAGAAALAHDAIAELRWRMGSDRDAPQSDD